MSFLGLEGLDRHLRPGWVPLMNNPDAIRWNFENGWTANLLLTSHHARSHQRTWSLGIVVYKKLLCEQLFVGLDKSAAELVWLRQRVDQVAAFQKVPPEDLWALKAAYSMGYGQGWRDIAEEIYARLQQEVGPL